LNFADLLQYITLYLV